MGRKSRWFAPLALALVPGAVLAAVPGEEPAPAPAPEKPAPAPEKPGEEGTAVPPPASKRLGERVLRLGLREAVAMALKNNLDLRAESFGPSVAAATVRESESLYDGLFTARCSGGENTAPSASTSLGDGKEIDEQFLNAGIGFSRLLPTGGTISLGGTLDRTLTNVNYYQINPRYESGVTLSLTQPLLRGAGREFTESNIRFSRDSKDIADLGLRQRTEELVQDVETAYWTLVQALVDVQAQAKSVAVAEDLLRITEARLAAGAGTRVDVSQAMAGVAARRVDLLRAENSARSFEDDLLGLLMSRSPGSMPGEALRVEPADDPNAALPPLPSEEPDATVVRALVDRSDVRIDRAILDQAQSQVVVAESDSKVQLNLEAAYGYNGVASRAGTAFTRSLAKRDWPGWSVGLALEIPIGNRAARARLDRATLLREQAEARLRALESNAAVRIRNARREVESTREQIDAARTATRLSEEQLEAEKERLKNDKSTTFEVLRLESDLTIARRSETRALIGYRIATVRHDFEAGRVLEARGLVPPGPASEAGPAGAR